MPLPTYQLFIGFPMGARFFEELKSCNPSLRELLIGESDEYLREVCYEEINYLGKYVGPKGDLSKILLLEANIYSILKKLVPHYPCQEASLHLFAVETP